MINKTSTTIVISGMAAIMLMTLMSIQPALASTGASTFAPGIVSSQSASLISPGAEEQVVKGKLPGGGCIASIHSPGNLFLQEPTTTDINP
jgi:hypothetical protein